MLSHIEAGIAAGIISIPGYVLYNLVVVHGAAKPSRTTWWVWTVVSGAQLVSYWQAGAYATLGIPIIYFVGRLITAVISLKYGEGGWTKLDLAYLIGVGIGLALWFIFDSPLIALLMALFLDFLGALPTLRKTYRNPHSEPAAGWIFWHAGALIDLFAIESWRFSIAIQPLYIVAINGLMVLLVMRRYCTCDRT